MDYFIWNMVYNNLKRCCEMGRLERERESQHCLPKDRLYST